jgi:hypothetical protein
MHYNIFSRVRLALKELPGNVVILAGWYVITISLDHNLKYFYCTFLCFIKKTVVLNPPIFRIFYFYAFYGSLVT